MEAAYRRATDQLKAGLQVHDEECERGGKVLGWELTSDALFQPSRSRAWFCDGKARGALQLSLFGPT